MPAIARFFQSTFNSRPLGIARIIVGIAVLMKLLIEARMIRRYFSDDTIMRFPHGIGSPLPHDEMVGVVLILLWAGFGALFLLGLFTRIAGAGLAITIMLVLTADQQLYSNHLYLMVSLVALLTLADAGARYSLDAWNDGPRATVPRWPARLLKLQLTSVYLFAAISKLNAGFLDGTIFRIGFEPSMLERVEGMISLETLAVLAILTEIGLAIGFWIRRARWIVLPVGIGFHIANIVIMERAGSVSLFIFALMMFSMMLLFFEDRFATAPATGRTTTTDQPPEPEHAGSTA